VVCAVCAAVKKTLGGFPPWRAVPPIPLWVCSDRCQAAYLKEHDPKALQYNIKLAMLAGAKKVSPKGKQSASEWNSNSGELFARQRASARRDKAR